MSASHLTKDQCDGRYAVPGVRPSREEVELITYRCGLKVGHDGPHGPVGSDGPDGSITSKQKWFRVEVSDAAGQVVAIESGNMLAGREIGPSEQAVIEWAIAHLSGFIGSSAHETTSQCPHGKPKPYLCLDCCNQQLQKYEAEQRAFEDLARQFWGFADESEANAETGEVTLVLTREQAEEMWARFWQLGGKYRSKLENYGWSPEETAGKRLHDEHCGNCGEPWSTHLTNKLICPDAAIADAYRFRQDSPEKARGECPRCEAPTGTSHTEDCPDAPSTPNYYP